MKRLFDEHIARVNKDLGGAWKFLMDPNDVGLQENWQSGLLAGSTVTVPSVWNTEIGLLNYDGAAWYEKKFHTEGGTLRFVFESVMTTADVWLDGEKLGNHYGGFSRFEFIARNVSAGEHTLVVRADSRADLQSIPQKKVDWYNYGGIARDVSLERLVGISILCDHLKYELSEDMTCACVSAELELYNADGEVRTSDLSVTVGDFTVYSGTVTLAPGETVTLTTPETQLSDIALWSIESPNLYTVTARTDTDDLIDRVGFRRVEVKNQQILLNGKSVELRGINRHEEHPDWGFAFPAKLMKRDLDIIEDLGCNTVRGAHYPQSRILLDMLDERGILFWSEIPIWGGGFPDTVLGDPVVVERGLEMHREMVKYYYNHPSIVIWGIHNEIYTPYPCTYEISKKYAAYLREHGGNRLITHAAAFPLEDDSLEFDDIICINMYIGWYGGNMGEWEDFLEKFRAHREKLGMTDKPVIFSEFGAGALYGCHNAFDSVKWSEEYQAELLTYCLELFHRDPMVVGFYIWQFCNIRTTPIDLNRARGFNNKGILDEYRNPKVAYFAVRKLYKRFAEEENK